ncbi:MAG: hypothetical protein ACM3X6_13400 [Patescibacteria group bacterium]
MAMADTGLRYQVEYKILPAFDLIGFTKIVKSGGELYREVREDGRWDTLRRLGAEDPTIYGVATEVKDCPKGHYRYTIAVKVPGESGMVEVLKEQLFPIHVEESEWVIFDLNYGTQYGAFWRDNPYAMIKKLGREFNTRLNLHIDAFPMAYASDADDMRFMMPVLRPA